MRASEISLGTWAFGSEWGTVSDDDSLAAMHRAVDLGVNLFDTADVYGSGRSETLIGRILKEAAIWPRSAARARRALAMRTTPPNASPSSWLKG